MIQTRYILVTLLLSVLSAPGLEAASPGRFVTAQEAWQLMADGAALLDTRPASDYLSGHLAGARNVAWDTFSDRSGRLLKGRLDPDDNRLGDLLGRVGVEKDRPVLVYGNPLGGWGEEGRVAWMLQTLGHDRVHLLDGGVGAWRSAGGELTREVPPAASGRFPVQRQAAPTASADQVAEWIGAEDVVLLDTRTREEFDGATWYGVPRGGHIPGARFLEWSGLLDDQGRRLSEEKVLKLMEAAGVSRESRIIPYCTGGVRSGFVYWVLKDSGFRDVRNFPGSFWEWSGRRQLPVER